MRFALADPPYIGQAQRHYAREARSRGAEASEVDHELLIKRLVEEFPDGWALCCHVPSLRILLPMCPEKTRVLAWIKTGGWGYTNPVYSWEPVLLFGGRKTQKGRGGVLDWVQTPTGNGWTAEDGTRASGMKPKVFCYWVFECLGAEPGDELVDMFPGSGAVGRAWESFVSQDKFDLKPAEWSEADG